MGARTAPVEKQSTEIKHGRGGKREGAGRPKGAQNKATVDVKEAAQAFTEDAISTLAEIMRGEHPAAARVAAANALLDRGYGKPKQSLDVDATVRSHEEALNELE